MHYDPCIFSIYCGFLNECFTEHFTLYDLYMNEKRTSLASWCMFYKTSFLVKKKGVAIDPTCINTGRLKRT